MKNMKPSIFMLMLLTVALNSIPLKTNATKRFVREGYTGTGEISWNNASGDLFGIIVSSQSGDTIWVAKGTYKPTAGTDREFSFFLKQGVVLQGGFAGYETYSYERIISNNPTILSGDIDPLGNGDSYHVIKKYGLDFQLTAATVLDGFIIQNGRADDPTYHYNPSTHQNDFGPNSEGGAMYLENSSPTIVNCRFISNYCFFTGGAVYSKNGSPSFLKCDFTDNDAGDFGFGGAMSLGGNGEVSIDECNFANNTSHDAAVLVTIEGIKVRLTRSILKQNHSYANGAIFFAGSTGVKNSIDNCLFIQNTISSSAEDYSKSIFSFDSVTISNCNFYNNAINEIQVLGNVFNCIFQGSNDMLTGTYYTKVYNSIVQGGVAGCIDCPGGNGNVNPLFTNINDIDGPDNVLGTADDGMKLSAYSAGIDAGLDSFFTTLDITGVSHGLDAGIDIGAYEGGVCIGTPNSRLYVDSSVSGGNGSGDSWQNAMADLRLALNVAKSCSGVNEIWTAKGTYKPTSTSDRKRYLTMLNGVSIYGGFKGDETALSQRNHRKYITTLSGNIDEDSTADSYGIIHNVDLNNTAQLDGFTITGANNESAGTDRVAGAAIYNSQSSPIFRNCVIKNNNAGNNAGGGMYNYNHSSPQVLNCVFANNTATGGGGMFNASNSSPVLRNCVLINNNSLGNGGGMASGINSNPTLINCNIIANTAVGNGDGIYNLITASPVITNCLFWGNGGAGKEIANGASSSVPVVSYSYVQGGYTPCTSCANNSISPQFLKDFDWAGADSVYATVDDEMHLGELSPCLNTGNNAVVVDSFDVAGQQRIQNGTVNIGAYENLYLITLGNGNWNTPTNWSLHRVPLASDHVYIKAGHVIQLNQPGAVCKSILIQPGAKLNLVLPGNLQVQ